MKNNKRPAKQSEVISQDNTEFVPRDLRDIEIDMSKKKVGRIRSFINQAGDPYRLRYGNAVIEMSYSNNGETLQDRIKDIYSDSHETEHDLNQKLEEYLSGQGGSGERKSVVGALREKQRIVNERYGSNETGRQSKKREQAI